MWSIHVFQTYSRLISWVFSINRPVLGSMFISLSNDTSGSWIFIGFILMIYYFLCFESAIFKLVRTKLKPVMEIIYQVLEVNFKVTLWIVTLILKIKDQTQRLI